MTALSWQVISSIEHILIDKQYRHDDKRPSFLRLNASIHFDQ